MGKIVYTKIIGNGIPFQFYLNKILISFSKNFSKSRKNRKVQNFTAWPAFFQELKKSFDYFIRCNYYIQTCKSISDHGVLYRKRHYKIKTFYYI